MTDKTADDVLAEMQARREARKVTLQPIWRYVKMAALLFPFLVSDWIGIPVRIFVDWPWWSG